MENNPSDDFGGCDRNEAGNILMDIRAHLHGDPYALPQVIILGGGSILREIDQDLLARAFGKHVVVKPLSGARLEYLFHAAAYVCEPYVQKIVIFGGTNDLTTKPTPPQVGAKTRVGPRPLVRTLLRREKSFHQHHPDVGLVICIVLNRYNVFPKISRHIQSYNAALLEADRNHRFFGSTQVIAVPDLPLHCFEPDGLHPNAQGDRALEQAFVEQLA